MQNKMEKFKSDYNNLQKVMEIKSQLLEVSYVTQLRVEWDSKSIIILLESIKLSKEDTKRHKELLDLQVQLSSWAIEYLMRRDSSNFIETLSRESVELAVDALQTRLTHCEKERTEGSKKFNVDTYIHMKLMYLDLRDALAYRPI
jgi:hypothetical protein